MSKFCIDLEGVMLPDAIAAVVEAWYEAQNTETTPDWIEDLRLQIKRNFGRGWTVRGVCATKLNPNGKCQLTRIAEDRSRSSVNIPIEWCESNAKIIKSHIFQLIDLYNGRGAGQQNWVETMDYTVGFASAPASVI
jgi:hypothetical protein